MHILTYVQVYVIVAYFYKCTMEFLNTVQSLSRVQLFVTPWSAACQDSLSIPNSQSLPKLMFIELVMPSNHLILCRPFLLLPSIFPSIKVFSSESVLISFRIDWFDLLAVQGTLKIVLQHQSSKASILWHSAFFTVQL